MHLIVGLGNPGSKYDLTRHNIGFMALDFYLRSLEGAKPPPPRDEQKALVTRVKLDDHDVLFVKPQTFMNLSGESVRGLLAFYKIPLENLLVIHDDIDQPFGAIRFHHNRGAGGHNGIKSITECLGTMEYARLKLGVGRPTIAGMDVPSYVLQNFSTEEMAQLPDFLHVAGDALESFLFDGLSTSSGKFNKSSYKDI